MQNMYLSMVVLHFMYLRLHFPFSCGWRVFDALLGASLKHSMQKGNTA